jgi:hypothetical protein
MFRCAPGKVILLGNLRLVGCQLHLSKVFHLAAAIRSGSIGVLGCAHPLYGRTSMTGPAPANTLG